MDLQDTKRLFLLLQSIYPNAARLKSENAVLAWQLVLEPFPYDDIRAAAIEHARSNRYPPDVSDLCRGLLPAAPAGQEPTCKAGEAWLDAISAGRCKSAAETLGQVSRYAREHGLSWADAKRVMAA